VTVGRQIRRVALVVLMILAALAAPVALPLRIVVLKRRREVAKTEFVVRHVAPSGFLPETV